jgi:hypothetical protein
LNIADTASFFLLSIDTMNYGTDEFGRENAVFAIVISGINFQQLDITSRNIAVWRRERRAMSKKRGDGFLRKAKRGENNIRYGKL